MQRQTGPRCQAAKFLLSPAASKVADDCGTICEERIKTIRVKLNWGAYSLCMSLRHVSFKARLLNFFSYFVSVTLFGQSVTCFLETVAYLFQ